MKTRISKKLYRQISRAFVSSFAVVLLLSNTGTMNVSAAEKAKEPTAVMMEANLTASQQLDPTAIISGLGIAVVDTKEGKLQGLHS